MPSSGEATATFLAAVGICTAGKKPSGEVVMVLMQVFIKLGQFIVCFRNPW